MSSSNFLTRHQALTADPRLTDLGNAVPEGASVVLAVGETQRVRYENTGTGIQLDVDPGDATADAVVQMDADGWESFISQEFSVLSLIMTGRAELTTGGLGEYFVWQAAFKNLYFGHPIFAPSDEPFAEPPVLTLDDDDTVLADALARYGFIHLRGVFSMDEIETMRADVEAAKAKATPDDGRSWWATLSDGTEVCCRVNYLSDHSAKVDSLTTDPRILRIGALPDAGLVCYDDGEDGHSVVIKYHDVAQGLADLPWHTDCGNGGHHLLCPGMNIGVQLDAATAETGQVHYLPGSTDTELVGGRPSRDWQTFAVTTEPGDVTVHMGHTWHAAPPPTRPGSGRRAMYLSFHRPALREKTGRYAAYNDVLFSSGSGRIRIPD